MKGREWRRRMEDEGERWRTQDEGWWMKNEGGKGKTKEEGQRVKDGR